MHNKKNIAQLYNEAVQSCQYHRVSTILVVENVGNAALHASFFCFMKAQRLCKMFH